jgi:peroxiredoxin
MNDQKAADRFDAPGALPSSPAGAAPSTSAEAIAIAKALLGPLQDRLDYYSRYSRARFSEVNQAYDELLVRLGPLKDAGPAPGELMPPFLLPNSDGAFVGLPSLLAQGPVVLSFNRGHWCPWCRLELGALADLNGQVEALGARIVSITPETGAFSRALIERTELPFTVLTDLDLGYTLSLDLAIWVGETIRAKYKENGIDLALFHNNEAWMLPVPATFVLRPDGMIQARFIDPDFRRRMEPLDILSALASAS